VAALLDEVWPSAFHVADVHSRTRERDREDENQRHPHALTVQRERVYGFPFTREAKGERLAAWIHGDAILSDARALGCVKPSYARDR